MLRHDYYHDGHPAHPATFDVRYPECSQGWGAERHVDCITYMAMFPGLLDEDLMGGDLFPSGYDEASGPERSGGYLLVDQFDEDERFTYGYPRTDNKEDDTGVEELLREDGFRRPPSKAIRSDETEPVKRWKKVVAYRKKVRGKFETHNRTVVVRLRKTHARLGKKKLKTLRRRIRDFRPTEHTLHCRPSAAS